MTAMLTSLLIISICTSGSFETAQNAELTVEIEKIPEVSGHMFIALYSSEESYLDTDQAFKSAQIPVTSTNFSWTCELPHGIYSVVVFHDMDDNGELNTSRFGLPKEPYGFSNNAKGMFGPPGFEQTSIQVKQDSTISISLR